MHALDRQQLEQAESTAERYAKLTLRALRALAVSDPEAAEALRLRYRAMPDPKLRALGRGGDQTALAILRGRIPSNAADRRKAEGSNYRPPHSATAKVVDAKGVPIWSTKLTSGAMTPYELSLPFPQNMLASHTEARAVRQAPLAPGRTLSIIGQYDPCSSCQAAMQTAATRRQVIVTYFWPGGNATYRP